MKIFSAQNTEHKEFSLIEFSSELAALPLLNDLPKEVKLIDMFSLLNGHFVAFVSCNNLKKTFETLTSHPAALGGYFTTDTIIDSLKAFYHLNKPSISDSVIVFDTDNFYTFFEVMDRAVKAKLEVLDVKTQRSFPKNTLYITGERSKIKAFGAETSKMPGVRHVILDQLSESFLNIF